MRDLETHLAKKVASAIGDVMQLVDDPLAKAKITAAGASIMFDAAVDYIRLAYEEDTGEKAEVEGVMRSLAKICLDQCRKSASKPQKPPARSSYGKRG